MNSPISKTTAAAEPGSPKGGRCDKLCEEDHSSSQVEVCGRTVEGAAAVPEGASLNSLAGDAGSDGR